MRSSLIARAASVIAAVLLMTACGGGSDDESASSSSAAAPSSAAESSSAAPQSDSEFCTEATKINERITTSLSQADSSSLSENLQTIADEVGVRAVEGHGRRVGREHPRHLGFQLRRPGHRARFGEAPPGAWVGRCVHRRRLTGATRTTLGR